MPILSEGIVKDIVKVKCSSCWREVEIRGDDLHKAAVECNPKIKFPCGCIHKLDVKQR